MCLCESSFFPVRIIFSAVGPLNLLHPKPPILGRDDGGLLEILVRLAGCFRRRVVLSFLSPSREPMAHSSSSPTRVCLIDDHPAIRSALRDKIAEDASMEVCGEAGSSDEAVRQIEQQGPDVAIVDIFLEDAHGLDLVQNLRAQCSDVETVVFSK